MKVAIIGSRSISRINRLEEYVPRDVSLIISGGARGVDQIAKQFARAHGLPLREFLPDYTAFGRSAPLVRNLEIIEAADLVLAFWDGRSRGTQFVVLHCRAKGVPYRLFRSCPP